VKPLAKRPLERPTVKFENDIKIFLEMRTEIMRTVVKSIRSHKGRIREILGSNLDSETDCPE
jgi:hypothetical protein